MYNSVQTRNRDVIEVISYKFDSTINLQTESLYSHVFVHFFLVVPNHEEVMMDSAGVPEVFKHQENFAFYHRFWRLV